MPKIWIQWLACVFLSSSVAHAQLQNTRAVSNTHTQTQATVGVSGEASNNAELTPSWGLESDESDAEPPSPWRLGVFTGVFFPSPGHSLFVIPPQDPYQAFSRYELGARLGYFPLPALGLELEFMHARGAIQPRDEEGYARADFNAYRAQLVGQLELPGATPFLVLGGGALQALSLPLGPETQPAVHAGIGVNVPITVELGFRLELRENVSERVNDRYAGLAFHEEVQVGLSFTPGTSKPAEDRVNEVTADADRDGVQDARDRCPELPALTEDGCPPDTDADGVDDSADACPRQAAPPPTGCPDLDQDRDGVELPCDSCPTQPGVAPDGCPVRDGDGDGDGLIDAQDKCPKQAETKNGFEDEDGCPDDPLDGVKQLEQVAQGMQFQPSSSELGPTSKEALTRAAAVLRAFPSLRIQVNGHASIEGGDALNERLGNERARAGKQWLTQAGIESNRIDVRGASSREPIADNSTAAGRQQNRRIELEVLAR